MESKLCNQTERENIKKIYTSEQIIIDGRRYSVVSVIPVKENKHRIESAADKIKYLISGGKK